MLMASRGFVLEAFRPKREKGGPWLVMSDEYMNWLLYTAHPAYDETCSPVQNPERCAQIGLLLPHTEHYGIVDVVAGADGITLDVIVRLPNPATHGPLYHARVRNTVRSYLERKLNEMGEPSVVPASVRRIV